MHHAGFLADDQCPLVSAEGNQDGRLSEIEIRTTRLGTVRTLRDRAPNVERILLGELARPEKFAGLETQRNNAIARSARWIRIVIARGNIDSAELFINRRRRPDTGAGRPLLLSAQSAFTRWLGRVGDCESLPDLLSGCCVQCDNAASERTALILGISRQNFFERRERLVYDAIVNPRRRSGHGRKVIDRPDFPDQLASRS